MLAHVGTERPKPEGGLLPTVAWRVDGKVEWALDGGVFTAGALLEWLSRDLGLAADPAALAREAGTVEDALGVRVLPALAGLGAPWWRPGARAVVAGLTAGVRPAHVARAALEAIAWRVADVVEAVREHAPVDVLRVDGGLTRDPLLLQLQADAAGVPVERGAVDATAAGARRRSPRSEPDCGRRPPRSPSGSRSAIASSRGRTPTGGGGHTGSGGSSSSGRWSSEAGRAWAPLRPGTRRPRRRESRR